MKTINSVATGYLLELLGENPEAELVAIERDDGGVTFIIEYAETEPQAPSAGDTGADEAKGATHE